jgi:hypothetical protein
MVRFERRPIDLSKLRVKEGGDRWRPRGWGHWTGFEWAYLFLFLWIMLPCTFHPALRIVELKSRIYGGPTIRGGARPTKKEAAIRRGRDEAKHEVELTERA